MTALAATTPALVLARLAARGASVTGREHVRLGKNNQDAWHVVAGEGRLAGVVCDGCGSQAGSEVGAQLGARFLAAWVERRLETHALSPALAGDAVNALVAWLYGTARDADPRPDAFLRVVAEHFLFTFLCVARQGGRALVFGLGDGAVWVDGEVVRLDAGPENAPAYAAYRLLDGHHPAPQIHFIGEARRIAVATDGLDAPLARDASAVPALFDDPVVWRNPAQLQRRLNVLAREERLGDDATVVLTALEGSATTGSTTAVTGSTTGSEG